MNRGGALFEKSCPPRTPSRKNFDGWGGCAAGIPLDGKRKGIFFRNFSECCPFCSTVPYSEKAFEFSSSLTQEKPPEYPRGLFLCPENVRQAVSQRLYSPGATATADGAFPLGRKRRADTAAYLPHHRCSAYLFICQGGAGCRPSSLRIGGVRGGEENVLPQKDLPPDSIPIPLPY